MRPSDGIDIIIRTQEPADWKIITKKYGTNLWNALGSPPAWNSAEKLLLLALFPLIQKKNIQIGQWMIHTKIVPSIHYIKL